MPSFDAIICMDWLAKYKAVIVCAEKIVRIPCGNGYLSLHGFHPTRQVSFKLFGYLVLLLLAYGQLIDCPPSELKELWRTKRLSDKGRIRPQFITLGISPVLFVEKKDDHSDVH
ncbi:hypothetical protein Tco_0110573 [Tanacetum coccineum]